MKIENDADVGRVFTMFKDKDYDPKVLAKGGVIECAPKNHLEEGKLQMSLLPLDLLSELLCPAYEEGLLKYERESWRKGFKVSVLVDAALRHLSKFYYEREDYDKETEEKYNIQKHHLSAVIFCCIAMYNSLKINKDLFDDRRSE